MVLNGEHIEYLNENISVIVSKEHTFGTDALLLASFSSPKRLERAVDLGTGCGVIPFYWLRDGIESTAYAVEIQNKAFSQLERSLRLNRAENRIKIYRADLRELKGILQFGEFDLVTMNPPYKKVGTGISPSADTGKIARHDAFCTLEDAACAASKLLRYGGRFCVCLRPERLCDAVSAMKKFNIEPKKIRFCAQKSGKAPWLLLIEGRHGGKAGMTVLPELHIEGGFGGYSEEMRNIIGEYYNK